MIYEMRTYTLKCGAVPEVEAIVAEALPYREKYSKLGAFWHTEFGPLNQVIHVWPYEDLADRDKVRAEAAKNPHWPPPDQHLILDMKSEIMTPAPFMRPLGNQQLGNIYEMRIYTYQPGSIPELLRRWAESLPYREEFSPLAAGMFTEFGGLNRWMHVWPYNDLGHRAEVRTAASQIPQWPSGAPGRVSQENKIMVPASFSPMH